MKLNNIHSTDPRSALTSGASFSVSRPVPLQLLGGCWGREASEERPNESLERPTKRLERSNRAGFWGRARAASADGLGRCRQPTGNAWTIWGPQRRPAEGLQSGRKLLWYKMLKCAALKMICFTTNISPSQWHCEGEMICMYLHSPSPSLWYMH